MRTRVDAAHAWLINHTRKRRLTQNLQPDETEVATFLVHEGDGHRVPCQIEWFVDGKSVIRDRHVFKNLVTGEIFRMFAEYIVRWIAWSTPHTEDKTITVFAAASLKSL